MNNTLKFNETSLYYIAPGFDWEPMMRFSNLATTFYYANLGYSKQQVLRRLQSDLAGSPFLRITLTCIRRIEVTCKVPWVL